MIRIPASSLSSYLSPAKKTETIKVLQETFDIDIHFNIHENPELPVIVFLNGAVDRSRSADGLVFQRMTWAPEIEAHCIFIADPTIQLSSDISIGWGLGNKDHHAILAMKTALDKLLAALKNIGLINKTDSFNIGFFGSSAGGFQALCLSALYKGSHASVINPQIDITQYFDKEVRAALWSSFGTSSIEQVSGLYESRLNVFSFYKSLNFTPSSKIYINTDSQDDINRDLPTIIRHMGDNPKLNDLFSVIFYSDPLTGHNPPNKEKSMRIIKEIIKQIN